MKSQLLLLGSLTLITLSGCSLNQAAPKTHHHDWIDVYNKSGNKVVSLTSRKAVAYVSDHVGDDAGNLTSHKLPAGSKLQYKYVMHQRRNNLSFNLYIYSNKYAKTGIHPLPNSTWKLSNHEFSKFSNPRSLE